MALAGLKPKRVMVLRVAKDDHNPASQFTAVTETPVGKRRPNGPSLKSGEGGEGRQAAGGNEAAGVSIGVPVNMT